MTRWIFRQVDRNLDESGSLDICELARHLVMILEFIIIAFYGALRLILTIDQDFDAMSMRLNGQLEPDKLLLSFTSGRYRQQVQVRSD